MNPEEFSQLFDDMMEKRRQEMLARYHRVLPSGEVIYNRFDKARALGFGEGSSIYDTSVVMGKPVVGNHVWIGPYTLLESETAQITIGDFVSIAAGSSLYTHDSTRHYLSGGQMPFDKGPITIGSNTVLCTGVTVSCGVTVGDHCVLAAHSFVNRDVPSYAIVGGTPARIIGHVVVQDGRFTLDYTKDEGAGERK